MPGTYDGIGRPLFGAYKAYQSNGTTEYLSVDSDGPHNFTFTDQGADNFIAVTVSDSTTVSSGYVQAFYASFTVTGSHTSQTNVFAADIAYGGTVSGEHSGMYLYFMESGTATFNTSDTQIKGITVYFSAFGTQAINRAGFHIYSVEPAATNASATDSALWLECSGTTGTMKSLLAVTGSTPPEFFFHSASNVPWGADQGCVRILGTDNTTVTGQMRVKLYETEYFIALYTTTCTD